MLKMNSKKGQGLVEVFSWFLVVFFTILFFILFSLPSCTGPPTQKLHAQSLTSLKTSSDLMVYLSVPVRYANADMTVADLIAWSVENKTIRDQLLPVDTLFVISNINDLESARAKKILDMATQPLGVESARLMNTYHGYLFDFVKAGLFCSLKLTAKSDSEEVILYNSLYRGYMRADCASKQVVAAAQIPGFSGKQITVEMSVTIDPRIAPVLALY